MGNLTLSGLTGQQAANPLTDAGSRTPAGNAGDFTQLLAGFQAGQQADRSGQALPVDAPSAQESATSSAADQAIGQEALMPSLLAQAGAPADATSDTAVRDDDTDALPADTALTPPDAAPLFAMLGLPVPQGLQQVSTISVSAADVSAQTIALTGMTAAGTASAGQGARAADGQATNRSSTAGGQDSGQLSGLMLPAMTGMASAQATSTSSRTSTLAPALDVALDSGTGASTSQPSVPMALTPVAANATSSAGSAVVTVQLPGHVLNDPGWSDAFRERVTALAQQGVQQASIRVTPDDMGPIHIHIAMNDQSASIEFKAQHPATSALIESMLPRLSGALAAQGIRVDDAQVSSFTRQDEAALQASLQQGGQQSSSSQQSGGREQRFRLDAADDTNASTVTGVSSSDGLPSRRISRGALDAYA